MPSASIVIRCFNEEKHIGNLLEKIKQQNFNGIEVVIVDSGSTDQTLLIVERYPVKLVQVAPEEFTFGYALNCGCAVANGDILIFASAHVLPTHDDWIEQLIKHFEDPRVSLVYGRQVGADTTKYSENQVFKKMFPAESNFQQGTPFCNNANSAIRADLWRKRPFDETLAGLEDLDWAKWSIEQGYLISYNARAEVSHIHQEAAKKIRNRYMREAIALKQIYPGAHMYFMEFLFMLISNIVQDIIRAVWDRKLFGNAYEILVFRLMQYWGTFKGLRYRSEVTRDIIRQFYYPRKIVRLQGERPRTAKTKTPSSVGAE